MDALKCRARATTPAGTPCAEEKTADAMDKRRPITGQGERRKTESGECGDTLAGE
ncbi:hypothetical protein KCP71_20985 [Salmonella enterica subsp. enterica]|nr:hypothetical protein KCP71_20985 [Salmonella enterica subsp. enterica]